MFQIVVFLPKSLYFLQDVIKAKTEIILQKVIEDTALVDLSTRVKIIFPSQFEKDYDFSLPSFAVYVTESILPERDTAGFAYDLLENDVPFLPIFMTNEPESCTPDRLKIFQGICYKHNFREVAFSSINCALNFFHLNGKWKVFISYSHKETREIALQVYEELLKHHYEPFLDTHSLTLACVFQQNLLHHLTDCDVMILLDSGENRKSVWCEEEVIAAQRAGIGVLHLEWDNLETKEQFDFCERIPVPAKTKRFSCSMLKKIITMVACIKTRSYHMKHQMLMSKIYRRTKSEIELCCNATGYYFKRVDNDCIIYPVSGVPESTDFEVVDAIRREGKSVELAYQRCNVSAEWVRHIIWLSSKTDIKVNSY